MINIINTNFSHWTFILEGRVKVEDGDTVGWKVIKKQSN